MGWTCQHDYKGYCKLLKKDCLPGIKGCILKKNDGIIFSTGDFEEDKNACTQKQKEIDFIKLARSN